MYIRKYLFFTLLLSTTVFECAGTGSDHVFLLHSWKRPVTIMAIHVFTGPADAVIPAGTLSQTEQPEPTGVFIDPAAIFSMETDAEGNSYIMTALMTHLLRRWCIPANSNSDNLWRLRSDGILI